MQWSRQHNKLQYMHSDTLSFCPRSCSWFTWLQKWLSLLSNTIVQGTGWWFRLKASAKNIKIWSAIEVTIWNMMFPVCTLGTYQPGKLQLTIPTNSYWPVLETGQQICLKWSKNPEGCSRNFVHICYQYIHFPHVTDKKYKATECPHKEKRAATHQPKGPPALMNL